MSANLDLVSSIFAAWEHGDFGSAEWADPEIEFARPDGPEPGRWIGVARMADYWREFLSTWQDFRADAESYRELDSGRVLVLSRMSGRGKESRLEIAQMRTEAAVVFHVRDDKVTRLVLYFDREGALADLGLEG